MTSGKKKPRFPVFMEVVEDDAWSQEINGRVDPEIDESMKTVHNINYGKKETCEFYPTGEEPTCECCSNVSGSFICTKQYSLNCQWAIERRKNG